MPLHNLDNLLRRLPVSLRNHRHHQSLPAIHSPSDVNIRDKRQSVHAIVDCIEFRIFAQQTRRLKNHQRAQADRSKSQPLQTRPQPSSAHRGSHLALDRSRLTLAQHFRFKCLAARQVAPDHGHSSDWRILNRLGSFGWRIAGAAGFAAGCAEQLATGPAQHILLAHQRTTREGLFRESKFSRQLRRQRSQPRRRKIALVQLRIDRNVARISAFGDGACTDCAVLDKDCAVCNTRIAQYATDADCAVSLTDCAALGADCTATAMPSGTIWQSVEPTGTSSPAAAE